MTNDLISRSELLLEMAAGCVPLYEKGISGVTGDESTIYDYIKNAPAVDAAPVVRCEFKRQEETKFPSLTVMPLRCGACGAEFAVLFRDVPGNVGFCPKCGCARMDKEAVNAQE